LTKEAPQSSENESNPTTVVTVDIWNHTDFVCINYILNLLDNTIYNVYSSIKSAKELWKALDKKYKAEDANMKKFIVSKFSVMSQVQESQFILHDIHVEGIFLSDLFQVTAIIEKL